MRVQEETAQVITELSQNQRAMADRAWAEAVTTFLADYPELAGLEYTRVLAENAFYRSCAKIAHKTWDSHENEIVQEARLCLLVEHREFLRLYPRGL